MTDTTDSLNEYFDDAPPVHAACAAKGFSRAEARLCTYIHVKTDINGPDYFDHDHPEDVAAIKALLGDAPEAAATRAATVLGIPRDLATVVRRIRHEHGMERYFAAALESRLRLYTDSAFRAGKLRLYRDVACPALEAARRKREPGTR